MKKFTFTVDDTILVFKDLTNNDYKSIFEHPYLATLRKLHEKFNVKIQLNVFYREGDYTSQEMTEQDEQVSFNLSQMTDKYLAEWEENANWLKMSFHSERNNVRPYKNCSYEEIYEDCMKTHREILRFAGEKSLAKTITVHYCSWCKRVALQALKDGGMVGLLGLYGTDENPRMSYECTEETAIKGRAGELLQEDGLIVSGIDVVLNELPIPKIIERLETLKGRELVKIMNHEMHFYPYDRNYQADFTKKMEKTFEFLTQNGFESVFFEEII